ncbi:hypothetical protein [Acidipropionibacterium virtanenii]|uniref:Integral membrane protein n=1 Tax=Acidipropionibacterium virtanenii TaxID=2057246 RepID=A0A344URY0_9ACTN|nr:hypothetical protein [Acidipropionibacterium virtanenii]AXE38028.1 hypothetical protein JS278_00841 [Acidipropionibacterium virtanenii]
MTAITETAASLTYGRLLRRLYFIRFVFAIAWAGLVFATASAAGPLLTALLIVYPLFDAGAVLWQLRAAPDARRSKTPEWINVVVSVAVAIALGIASATAVPAALVVWGVWAVGSGIPQLITAIRNRRSGGQVAQMLSGGISVLAGAGFLLQGLQGAGSIAGVAGYATLGGVFFVISALRLTIKPKESA